MPLTPSRSATVHAGTSSTRPERRSTSGVRSWRNRSRHRQFDTVVLATSPLAHPVQTVLHNAFCFLWQIPCIVKLTNIVRTVTAACSRSGLKSTSSYNFAPSATVEIRRAFLLNLFTRWALRLSVERSVFRHSCCRGHERVQTSRQNSLF